MQRKGTLEKWEEPLKWEIDELAEPLLIKRKIKYTSRGDYNDAIRKAIKIGWRAGVKWQKGMEELERRYKLIHNQVWNKQAKEELHKKLKNGGGAEKLFNSLIARETMLNILENI